MRVSLNWLKEYVDLVLPPEEIARRLTMAGTEVGAIQYIGRDWESIYVAEIIRLAPHPNADRLQLVTLNYGAGTERNEITVVAGAFNVKVGDKVPLALPGARVIDTHSPEPREVVLKANKLRGIMSEGMVCSTKELGINDEHTGIMILDPEARVGARLGEEIGDVIFDLEVTPNRGDMLSMIGVAREVAGLTGQEVRLPVAKTLQTGDQPAGDLIEVEIAAPDLCHRYTATLIMGVNFGPSPKWMRDRLTAAGQRPISNVVDVTNYVMLEWGQPLHAFDYDAVTGHKIIVRRARPGEELITLDGVERKLTPDMLVIADAERAVGLAGVMGGANSEISDKTVNILLESANFDRANNRRTSRALRLPSEASRRFEKGLPEDLTLIAGLRATQLIHELAGGTVAKGVVDAYPVKARPTEITLTTREVERLLGVKFDVPELEKILRPLGFQTKPIDGGALSSGLEVQVPMQRTDVRLPADLVEEIARTVGYDSIPSATLSSPLPPPSVNESRRWEETVRDVMVGCGFAEIITYSMTSRERVSRLVPVSDTGGITTTDQTNPILDPILNAIDTRISVLGVSPLLVVNPLSADLECVRTTTLVSMLETLRSNLRFSDKDVDLFEIGRIYVPRGADELPEERCILTAGMGQYRSGGEWGARQEVSFYDLKAAAEAVLQRMGIKSYSFVPVSHPTFQIGRTAAIVLADFSAGVLEATRRGAPMSSDGTSAISSDQVVGIIGEVNRDVRSSFDLDERVYVLAMDLNTMMKSAVWDREYRPLPKFPPVEQDMALVVDAGIPAGVIGEIIRRAGGELVRVVELFDVYEGPGIPEGKRSLAFHIVYQSSDRTLTDQEVNKLHGQIEGSLNRQLGATLRR